MAPPGEGPQAPEGLEGGKAAKGKLADVMPPKGVELQTGDSKAKKGDSKAAKEEMETKYTDNTAKQEAERTDYYARADMIALYKQGKAVPETGGLLGLDAKTMEQIRTSLKAVTTKTGNFAVNMAQVEIEVQEKGETVTKTVYFAAVKEGGKAKMVYKVGENFDPNPMDATKVSDLEDDKLLALLGAKSDAADSRLEERINDVGYKKQALDSAKDTLDKAGKDDKAKAKAQKEYEAAKASYDDAVDKSQKYQKNYVAMGGKKSPNKVA